MPLQEIDQMNQLAAEPQAGPDQTGQGPMGPPPDLGSIPS